LVRVYTLQAEMKSGGGLVSEIDSQLESPEGIGETVYENFTGKYYYAEDDGLWHCWMRKSSNFLKKLS